MIGNYAKKVKFNYEGIKKGIYSRELFNDWEANMKGAISGDVIAEDTAKADIRLEEAHRYCLACEEVIINLMYWCKWHYLPTRLSDHESKG